MILGRWPALRAAAPIAVGVAAFLLVTLSLFGYTNTQVTLPAGGIDSPGSLDPTLLYAQGISYSLGDGVVLSMVRIPAGEFEMGSRNAGEASTGSDEGPLHHVVISSGFEMSEFEVTRAVFGKVMGWGRLDGGVDKPVTGIDFDDCILFCNRLSERFGLEKCYSGSGKDVVCDFSANGFRLPTEAEWEYACRAGTSSLYCTGDEAFGKCKRGKPASLECVGWFKNNSNGRVHSVGELAPNAFGLYDMHGNVWERCWDFYDENCYASSQSIDPHGPEKGTQRVVRGGCYQSNREDCRSATRGRLWPGARDKTVGFRVVRVAHE